MVSPLRPSSALEVLRDVAASLVDSTTFSATLVPFSTAFLLVDFTTLAADLAADVALLAESVAARLALEAPFLALDAPFLAADAAVAAVAAARTLVAVAAVNPAALRSLALDAAIFATVSSLAAASFLAVAAPTPGRFVNSSSVALPFPAMPSPNVC